MNRTFDPISDFSIETRDVSTFSKDMSKSDSRSQGSLSCLKTVRSWERGRSFTRLSDYINSHSRRAELEEMALRRALHFVFKIGNRNETIKFYREILGMKVRGISYCVSDFGASFRACPLDDSVGSYNLAPCCIVVCCLYLINTVGIKSNSSRFLKECVLFIRFCAMKSLKRAVRHLAMGTYVM